VSDDTTATRARRGRARAAAAVAFAALSLSASVARADGFEAEKADYRSVQRGLLLGLGAQVALTTTTAGVLFATDPLPGPRDAKRREFERGFAAMWLAYAAVNGAIVVSALAASPPNPESGAALAAYRNRNATFYAVNHGLDMLYVSVGAVFWAEGPRPFVSGLGAGMATQGLFLLGFDGLASNLARH
jgi:hypothetical protein